MSFYHMRNLKIDKKNNKISCEIADSNCFDWKNRLIWDKIDDLYSNFNVIEDKIAVMMKNIIEGNIHTSNPKYKDLVCRFELFEGFLKDINAVIYKEGRKDYEIYNVYLKHKDEIESYTKKDCVLKQKGWSNRYAVRVNQHSISINYGIEKARKFNSKLVQENDWYMENFDIVYI